MSIVHNSNVIGAFSEEHAERLSGVSLAQLRRWDRLGFFKPSFAAEDRHLPYSRVYSFKDLVALRVLNELRNNHGVSLQHLRRVAETLGHLKDDLWSTTTLSVLNKRVVFNEPETSKPREVVSGQYVADIPLRVVISSTRRAVGEMNRRTDEEIGLIVRAKFNNRNAAVFAGTRIPVSAIRHFAEAGYSTAKIVKEYPDLTVADIEAALAYQGPGVAA